MNDLVLQNKYKKSLDVDKNQLIYTIKQKLDSILVLFILNINL